MLASLSESVASNFVAAPNRKRKQIPNMSSHGGTSVRVESAKWSSHAEYEFVDVMYDEVLKGNIYTTSFTPMVWSDIRTKLLERTGIMFSVKQMKGKLNRLKEMWRRYYDLMLATTGIGWNVETNLPQAEPIIWEQLAERNRDFLELRYKPFPHYIKLDVVFSGRAATGGSTRASTQRSVPRRQECSDIENETTEVRSAGVSTPITTSTRSTGARSGKRKVNDEDVVAALVEQLNQTRNALTHKAEVKESWSVEKVVNVLLAFDDLDEPTFNAALMHFKIEINRRVFMALPPARQRSYITYNISSAPNE